MDNNCRTEPEGHSTDPRRQPNKQCPRCGKWFHCSHSGKCWCMEYQLTADIRTKLEAEYSDCLCENCLKEFEKQK
ncbi:MAG: hypothetical protein CVU06_14015 [Bacteroidetes bacterium HGW-Bacteroidetes-22]|nr:MAG: hypothetical protein CVU06_14015 [Bacteroidetes bacterium HGW-Bacteroidetes-22]